MLREPLDTRAQNSDMRRSKSVTLGIAVTTLAVLLAASITAKELRPDSGNTPSDAWAVLLVCGFFWWLAGLLAVGMWKVIREEWRRTSS